MSHFWFSAALVSSFVSHLIVFLLAEHLWGPVLRNTSSNKCRSSPFPWGLSYWYNINGRQRYRINTCALQLVANCSGTPFFSGILPSLWPLPVELVNASEVLKENYKFCYRWKISCTVLMTRHCTNWKKYWKKHICKL